MYLPTGVRAEQVRQILSVDHLLVLRDVELASLLVELFVGPAGMLLLQLAGDQVVIAHEQGLQGRQLDVLVAPHVAGREQVRPVATAPESFAMLISVESGPG